MHVATLGKFMLIKLELIVISLLANDKNAL